MEPRWRREKRRGASERKGEGSEGNHPLARSVSEGKRGHRARGRRPLPWSVRYAAKLCLKNGEALGAPSGGWRINDGAPYQQRTNVWGSSAVRLGRLESG